MTQNKLSESLTLYQVANPRMFSLRVIIVQISRISPLKVQHIHHTCVPFLAAAATTLLVGELPTVLKQQQMVN